ncbi:DNA-binding protein [Candidatus Margulisiibacteriota bacterium]
MKLKILCLLFVIWSLPAWAVTGNELVEKAKAYDGKAIEYAGEVVGDVMARENHAWLNVNDGTRAIGIWAKKDSIKDLKIPGDYNYIGDKILVKGIFHRACPQHGGDLDIHAQEIVLIEPGHKVEHPINQVKIYLSILLLIAIIGVIFWPKSASRQS